MKNGAATAKAKAVKAAVKKITAATPPYKHESQALATSDPEGHQQARTDAAADAAAEEGVDSPPAAGIQSGFSVFNQSTSQGATMDNTGAATAPQAPQAQLDKEAAAKAKIAAKEAKIKEAAERKAKVEAEAKVRAEQREKDKQVKAAEREAAAKRRVDQIAAANAEVIAADKTRRLRHYLGTMLVLADRAKAGAYVKGLNGQLRSSDEVATILESVPADRIVELLMKVFHETVNKYAALNYGQQSMNYRNRLRGALRKGLEVGDPKVKITLEYLKQVRDDGNFATVEADLARKADEKKDAEAKKKAEAKLKAAAEAEAKKKAVAAASKTSVPLQGNIVNEALATAA